MTRLYFNLTNKCNTECEFCCMYSNTSKNTFLAFDKFKEIVDVTMDDFELQLEGGEPLLHPNLFLFLEYAKYTGRCIKVILSTNGLILDKYIDRLIEFKHSSSIPFLVKRSINFHLFNIDKKIFEKSRSLLTAVEFIDGFDIRFNVRIEKNDTLINELLIKNKLIESSDVYNFQKYGKYSDKEEYVEPFICQNIDNWFIFSSDGECFGQDLIGRSLYEKTLN